MPATEHAFSGIPPADIYIDTDVIVGYLISTDVHHARRVTLFRSLVRHRQRTTIYISPLTWTELANVVSRENFRGSLPAGTPLKALADRWEDHASRQQYVQLVVGMLRRLL